MASTYYRTVFHIVFSTKNRSKILRTDLRIELFDYFGQLCADKDCKLLQGGGIEDHVHLLVDVPPKLAISDLVKFIKGNTARWINENRKIDCRFSWQKGYGVFSVSQSAVQSVTNYIKNQIEHHRAYSYEQEYLSLLAKHKVPFNEKFVFPAESE